MTQHRPSEGQKAGPTILAGTAGPKGFDAMEAIHTAGEPRNSFVASRSGPVVGITVARQDQSTLTLKGREAFALDALICSGASGVTPIEKPAPRWSDYVFKLRKRGLVVETIDEKHAGAFAGSHARYVLRTPLTVVETKRQGEGGKA